MERTLAFALAVSVGVVLAGAAGCAHREQREHPIEVQRFDAGYSFTNADGTWTIRTRCRARGRTVVGPGYVSRVVAKDGTVIVDDLRRQGTLNDPEFGGLGAFGWHHARGRPGQLRFRGANAWEISGRTCAQANRGFGVVETKVVAGPAVDGDGVRLAIDVLFGDAYTSPAPLLRARYRYRVTPTLVQSWIDVTSLCPGGRCGRTRALAFVKEPKLVAHVTGGGYTRMATFGEGGSLVCVYVGGGGASGPIFDTGQCDAPERTRLRFDYGSATSGESGDCESRPCLDVVMRAVAADGTTTEPWARASRGFDAWALASASRPAAFGRDTASIDGVVWSCKGGSTADPAVRRWETTGRRDASGRYIALGGLFPAWEGGRGGYDCEPLARVFGPRGESFSAYAAYSLTP